MHEETTGLPAGAGSAGRQNAPYNSLPSLNPIINRKRKELAKKKADIISGQNSQTAAGSAGARMESLNNMARSKPRPKFEYR